MKVFVPYRRVYPPSLSRREKDDLMKGRSVELDGNLKEGDVFLMRSGGEGIIVQCLRSDGETFTLRRMTSEELLFCISSKEGIREAS